MSTAHDAPALTVDATEAYRRHVEEAAAMLRTQVASVPSLGLVLETGRASLPDAFAPKHTWTAGDLPHVPALDPEAPFLTMGTLDETPILVFHSPRHLYDGYTPRQVTFPIRMLAVAGVDTLCFTNTAGSIRPEIEPTDLVLTTDHINFQGVNPLVGPNVSDWGPRFPDMSEPYDPDLRKTAQDVALHESIKLHKGIYLATLGPNLGTRAEYRMIRTMGADMVGTSTVPEVIAARHMNVRVLAMSVIVDVCSPDAPMVSPASATDILESARPRLRRLLHGIVATVGTKDVPA